MSTLTQIPAGPYLGFTYPELVAELARYKEEVKTSGTRIVGASVNGQSFQFGNREGSSEEWSANLQQALGYLRPDLYPFAAPSDRAAVRLV
jgi:hypothetical protein